MVYPSRLIKFCRKHQQHKPRLSQKQQKTEHKKNKREKLSSKNRILKKYQLKKHQSLIKCSSPRYSEGTNFELGFIGFHEAIQNSMAITNSCYRKLIFRLN